MNNHTSNVCRYLYFHIRALHHIRQALTDDMAKTVAASLIHIRIDNANCLIRGTTNVKKLQRVQTSVACVVLPNLSQQPATALLAVPNDTAHPSTASVPITVLLWSVALRF